MAMLQFNIDSVIYFYMLICIALLIFNVGYIMQSNRKTRKRNKRILRWQKILIEQMGLLEKSDTVSPEHQRFLVKKLTNIEQLIAFHEAILLYLEYGEGRRYLELNHDVFQVLALAYTKKVPMEKAFFAYLMSIYRPACGEKHDQLVEILLDFMRNSTVYCRENVLQAIYVMGNPVAVESAFHLLSDQELYHNPRLLSDGMMNFSGDKEDLAGRLWAQRHLFGEFIQVTIVQFATQISSIFADTFLQALKSKDTMMEVRFAIIRYFQKNIYGEALPYLLFLAKEGGKLGEDLAIPACAALVAYPGEETEEALKQAIHSKNWYVRKNAATALIRLGIAEKCLDELKLSKDRYAEEMLSYLLDKGGGV